MDCNFCKKVFSTKTNLGVHQKTAKYCLQIQGKENATISCEYCNKIFTSLQNLTNYHLNSCKEKKNIDKIKQDEDLKKKYESQIEQKDKDIINLKEYISKLEAKLEKFENACINASKNKSIDDDFKETKSSSTNQP